VNGAWHSEVAPRLADPAAERWRALTDRGSLYTTDGWLDATSDPPPLRAVTFCDSAAAASACYLLPAPDPRFYLYDPHELLFAPPDEFWTELGDRTDGSAILRVEDLYPSLSCGPLSGFHNTLLLSDRRADLVRRLLDLLGEEARRRGARAVVFPFLEQGDLELLQEAEPELLAGFAVFDYLLPGPASFEAYLQSLPKKLRRTVHRERRLVEAAGHRVEVTPLSACLEPALAMIEPQLARHGHSAESRAQVKRLWIELSQSLPTQGRALVLRGPGGEALGYNLTFIHGRRLYVRQLCRDPARLHGEPLFELTYYAPIDLAAKEGVEWIELGAGGMAAKLSRGGQPCPVFYGLWLLDPHPRRQEARLHLARRSLARLDGFARLMASHRAAQRFLEGGLGQARALFER
jgi:predicted N-acyltransferase